MAEKRDVVRICPLSAEFVPAAVALSCLCFHADADEGALTAGFRNPANRWFAAVEKGELVGFAGYFAAADQADILDVAVLPAHRRRGIARALMETVLAEAASDGVQTMFLEVRASNAPAIALYTLLGFTPCGKRKNYYSAPREDAVLMQCPLSAAGRTE